MESYSLIRAELNSKWKAEAMKQGIKEKSREAWWQQYELEDWLAQNVVKAMLFGAFLTRLPCPAGEVY